MPVIALLILVSLVLWGKGVREILQGVHAAFAFCCRRRGADLTNPVCVQPMWPSFGKWYVKTMNNVKTKGVAYLEAEFKRLLKMVYDQKDSLKLDKLAEFRIRLAVLKVFFPSCVSIFVLANLYASVLVCVCVCVCVCGAWLTIV
jgi:hypothetical protein